MANCKECYHTEVCSKHNRMVQIDEHTWDEYEQLDDVEKFCEHYKSAADVVEVVRCEDCKNHIEETTVEWTPYGFENENCVFYCKRCEDEWKQVMLDDYCSYGERKPQKEG